MESLDFTLPKGGIVGVISIGYDGAISGGAAVSGFGPVTDYEVAGTAQLTGCAGKLSLKVRPKGAKDWGTEIDRFVLDPDGKTLASDSGEPKHARG